jgi:hypothetical protein
VPERPVIVFDVNETLLDLDAIRPVFDRIFGDPAALRRWFADLGPMCAGTPPPGSELAPAPRESH